MNFRAQTPQRKAEVVVVTPGYTSPEGAAARVAGELATVISRRSPFHFAWAAHGAQPPLAITSGPALTLLPMQGWEAAEKLLGINWPFWSHESRIALGQAIAAADIVWIHDMLYPGARMALRLARRFGKPVLVTQHESPAFAVAHSRNPFRRLWVRLVDRLFAVPVLRQARQVTFTSNAASRFYHRRINFAAPPRVIPNGVDGQIFHPPSPDEYKNMRIRFALRDDQPVLLFVGRFDEPDAMLIIRHMARLLPKWRFWLAGHGRARPESWYLPNVQVFRGRAGGALAELYQAADLLILPGADPESPYVLHQALACQLPIMCNPVVVAEHPAAARCLVINTNLSSPEETAKQWVQKLMAGKDVWPVPPEDTTPFDSSWEWLQVAAYYTEILQTLSQPQAQTAPVPVRSNLAPQRVTKTAG